MSVSVSLFFSVSVCLCVTLPQKAPELLKVTSLLQVCSRTVCTHISVNQRVNMNFKGRGGEKDRT